MDNMGMVVSGGLPAVYRHFHATVRLGVPEEPNHSNIRGLQVQILRPYGTTSRHPLGLVLGLGLGSKVTDWANPISTKKYCSFCYATDTYREYTWLWPLEKVYWNGGGKRRHSKIYQRTT